MASLSSPTLHDAPVTTPAATPVTNSVAPAVDEAKPGGVLVAGFGDPCAADYAAYMSCGRRSQVSLVADAPVGSPGSSVRWMTPEAFAAEGLGEGARDIEALVMFLSPRMGARHQRALEEVVKLAVVRRIKFACIVSTGEAHLDDTKSLAGLSSYGVGPPPALPSPGVSGDGKKKTTAYMASSADVLRRLRGGPARIVVFRPGHILGPSSRVTANLRRFGACYPLVPRRLHGCCVDGDELFAAIEKERAAAVEPGTGGHGRRSRRPRVFALFGPNRPWRDWLARHRTAGPLQLCVTIACTLLGALGIGQLTALLLKTVRQRKHARPWWNVDTLRPGSFRDLLALYNKYNYRHVKVVGYNNGVNHFGHRYPGKTIVSTVRLNRVVRAGPESIRADCGATIRKALDFLAGANQDLYVIPNYSYVCLGTAFFVPIHGSAAAYSCVADTITKAVLYDPVLDRLIAASRDEPEFSQRAYDLQAEVLLLRLSLKVKARSRYFVHQEDMQSPSAGDLLAALRDERAANVEVRKSNGAATAVQVFKYYNDPGAADSPVLELPRDRLGQLWDRLEENPITSFLMHTLTRLLAFHCELFFTAEEFATFWAGHGAQPIRKIQLRFIRRDGLPHSPFRDRDCVSADMFMFRRNRRAFEDYLSRTFDVIRANPGKHSV